MKKISIYLFLIFFGFSAPSYAGGIRDYQIEGMSVGDNLLDYFSEKEIKKFEIIPTRWRNNYSRYGNWLFDEITEGITISSPNFKIYDEIDVLVYLRGEIYEIWGLTGKIFYQNDINECHKKMNEIVREFSKTFSNLEKYKKLTEYKITTEITTVQFGGEVYTDYHATINNGASVSCLDFSVGSEFTDYLSVSIYSGMETL